MVSMHAATIKAGSSRTIPAIATTHVGTVVLENYVWMTAAPSPTSIEEHGLLPQFSRMGKQRKKKGKLDPVVQEHKHHRRVVAA